MDKKLFLILLFGIFIAITVPGCKKSDTTPPEPAPSATYTVTCTHTITPTFTVTPTFTNTPCIVAGYPEEPWNMFFNVDNFTHFVPFTLASPATVNKIMVRAASFGTGSYKAGIYDDGAPKTLLVSLEINSASMAQNAWNQFDVSDYPLAAGNYWIAVAGSHISGNSDTVSIESYFGGGSIYTKGGIYMPAAWDGTYDVLYPYKIALYAGCD